MVVNVLEPDLVEMCVGALDKIGKTKPKRPIVFECGGVPSIIDQIFITASTLRSRVVVAGVCMEPDRFRPVMAVNKQIDLRFVVGYDPLEFRVTLHMLSNGKVDAAPLVTGIIGLDGVAGAFDVLGDPERHAKIVIDHEARPSHTECDVRTSCVSSKVERACNDSR